MNEIIEVMRDHFWNILAVIGAIAALITIFQFLTGRFSIVDITRGGK